jgi:hypothetical protein
MTETSETARAGSGWRAFVRPDGYVPVSERVLPQGGAPRSIVVALFASTPFVHLLATWATERVTGLTNAGLDELAGFLPARVLNAYLILLTIWAADHIAARLREVRALVPEDVGPRADWRTWLVPPLVFIAMFSIPFELTRLEALPDEAAGRTATTIVSVILQVPIRLTQASAFWTVVVAVLAVGRMHRLPGTFPEDRMLGLRPVGALLTTTLLLYAAAFAPSFLFGVERVSDVILTSFVFLLGLGAMVLAVSRLHRAMVEERNAQVGRARERFAVAYRAVEAQTRPKALEAQVVELQAASAILQGAESIFEWPFDERMQRIAAIVVTGVITGLVVRLILLGLGI